MTFGLILVSLPYRLHLFSWCRLWSSSLTIHRRPDNPPTAISLPPKAIPRPATHNFKGKSLNQPQLNRIDTRLRCGPCGIYDELITFAAASSFSCLRAQLSHSRRTTKTMVCGFSNRFASSETRLTAKQTRISHLNFILEIPWYHCSLIHLVFSSFSHLHHTLTQYRSDKLKIRRR